MAYEVIVGRNEGDKKKFGNKGAIFLGKSYVKMGRTTSLSNSLFLDVNRTHVFLVAGKRGCLIGDTMIYTHKGYKKIEDFDEDKDKVYSFNKEKTKLELEKARLLKYNLNENLFFLTLKDGQELIATAEHPFLVKSNKKYSWKIASELTNKDKIVSALKLPAIKIHSAISKRMARLLGFVLADGTLFMQKGIFKDGRGSWYNGTKKRLRIFNAQEEVLKQAKEDLEIEFNIKAKRYRREKYNSEVIETKHQRVVNKFVSLGVPIGKKSNIIRVPKIIFSALKETKAEFLKALFSCDGTVDKDGGGIEYYSNSKNFIKDLQLLLNEFGIHGKVRKKKTSCNNKKFISYVLSIWDYESIKTFEDYISFFSKEKRDRLKKRKFWRMSRRKKTEYLSNEFFFEDIINISKKKYTGLVYDLRVPKNHSFIANGIVSHNSGKSYSLGVITEGMVDLPTEVAERLSVIILDTMGIFWTMKYSNDKDEELLKEWKLKPKGLDVKVYVPKDFYDKFKEEGVLVDNKFAINPAELSAEEWCLTFKISLNDPMGVLIEKTVYSFREKDISNYSIDDLIKTIRNDKETGNEIKNALINRFESAKNWGVFDKDATKISDIAKGGQASIIDVSCYNVSEGGWEIKSLVIGIICRKLFNERMMERKKEELELIKKGFSYIGGEDIKSEKPLVWVIIDEAHEFLPMKGKTSATDALITILREGRQPGVSLILATQQPGKIHRDVMTQADLVLSHRLTAKQDIEALNEMMQSYMTSDLVTQMNNLPDESGAALLLDDNSERIYPMRVRPRFTWHGGESPSALSIRKKLDLGIE